MEVYIVTNVELGWDCIVGVFGSNTITLQELKNRFSSNAGYVIFKNTVLNDLEDYE